MFYQRTSGFGFDTGVIIPHILQHSLWYGRTQSTRITNRVPTASNEVKPWVRGHAGDTKKTKFIFLYLRFCWFTVRVSDNISMVLWGLRRGWKDSFSKGGTKLFFCKSGVSLKSLHLSSKSRLTMRKSAPKPWPLSFESETSHDVTELVSASSIYKLVSC